MIKSDSHDSGVENHSYSERLVKNENISKARLALRQHRHNSATTTSGDETKREVPDIHLQRPASRPRRKPSPNPADLPPLSHPTTVTVEHETRPTRKKKTFKKQDGEEIEMAVRKRSGSRQRRRQRTPSGEAGPETDRTVDPDREKILGVVIHRTDRLRTDLRLRHPFVRIHFIDLSTRSYLRKTDPNRAVFRFHNQTDHQSDHIPSICTDPYNFNANRSTIPSWEKMFIINEEFSHFTTVGQGNVYIFFEILEFINNQQDTSDASNSFPLAWAFLKLVGARNNLNTERVIRLQLWEPFQQQHSATPDVLLWFNQTNRQKYPSTLYVTIKSLNRPSHFHPELGAAVTGGIDQMRGVYRGLEDDLTGRNVGDNPDYDSENQAMNASNAGMGPLQRVEQLPPRWQKFSNSKCKIPTEPLISLKTSDRGCSSIRFSHNGYFLAYAEVSKSQNNVISISQIPEGQNVARFSGHLQMVYDLDWSKTDRYLASASADSSVKVWNFERVQRKPWRTLSHPSFVYCVRFHPLDENIVVTAGYDKQIRVWTLEKKHGSTIRTMADHLGYISSLSFNPDGTRLASVDSIGAIKTWHGLANEANASHRSGGSWSLDSNFDFPELQSIPLNSVSYSPRDHYLLISARDNIIMLVDTRTKSISRRYFGAFNIQDRIRCTFSQCGSLIFSGSEDRQVQCWHTHNGTLLYSYQSLDYTQPVVDVQFHPFDNILAMCSIGPSHQVHVFQHTFNGADVEAKVLQEQSWNIDKSARPTSAAGSMANDDYGPKTSTPMPNRHAHAPALDSDRSTARTRLESSPDESSRARTSSRNESGHRRLAVVNKILDEMDDVINPKSRASRSDDPIPSYGGGHLMSRSTERDVSPYQGRRRVPSNGYNSDSGRAPLVSPLRGLTSPDLFVPVSNRTDEDDYISRKGPASSSSGPIMYATTSYTAQGAEELTFAKNDQIKIIHKESHLAWYAENMATGARGYVSPNRVHVSGRETHVQSRSAMRSHADMQPISEVPRLHNSAHPVSQRIHQKSVKFDSSD